MIVSWDPNKASTNLQKHGISFEVAATVFNDSHHLSILNAKSRGNERWATIGLAAYRKTLVVVHTYFDDHSGKFVRIISARRTTKKERQVYEKGI
ncbi:MAG: BrnT family toxin [Pseudobdellovibrionaceae bacterium]|nr:BrnT family toxin [Bdellovibrionales bacterium]USN48774.1 MAG: BrnT family toxin [Pseudobdellovibrionaceae bacterium]